MGTEQKRYSLVHGYNKSDYLRIIDFKKENNDYVCDTNKYVPKSKDITIGKHTLAEIDMFTNSFDSPNSIFNFALGDIFERDPEDVYILYKHNGYNSLIVHFGNKELKEKASKVVNSTINDPEEINAMTKLLLDRNSRFLSYLACNQDHYTLHDETILRLAKEIRIKQEYAEGSICDTYDIYNDTLTLKKKLTNYKIYREVFLAKQSYLKHLEELNQKPNNGIEEFKGFVSDNNGQLRMLNDDNKPKVKKIK